MGTIITFDVDAYIKTLDEEATSSTNRTHLLEIEKLARLIRLSVAVHTCTISFVDLNSETIDQIGCSSTNTEFENILKKKREVRTIHNTRDGSEDDFGIDIRIAQNESPFESEDLQDKTCKIANPEVAKRYGLRYGYCHPVKIAEALFAYVNIFSDDDHPLSDQIKSSIRLVARFAEVPLRQYYLQKRSNQILVEAIEEMANVVSPERPEKILKITLKQARRLLNSDYSSILKLDNITGELKEIDAFPETSRKAIHVGEGYCSRALDVGEVIVADASSPDWGETHVDAWDGSSREEMVVPLLIKNETTREGTGFGTAFKPIGTLNFESKDLETLKLEYRETLLPLVSQASLLIEKVNAERKVKILRDTERKLPELDWENALQAIANGVREASGFEVVNISLVDSQRNVIETEAIVGLKSSDLIEPFKRHASHSLGDKDIQASVVKNKKVEVPNYDDVRFDRTIWSLFGHENLIRVYVPIVDPIGNRCIGTIDAGYSRGLRKHIYESDVQILLSFAELVVEAVGKRKSVLLDKITHEFRAPVNGILGHTDRLKRHHQDWNKKRIDVKLKDIDLDCEILLNNVEELEYFLGRPSRKLEIEKVMVMKDIVVKSLNQLKPLMQSRDLPTNREFYLDDDIRKIEIYTDRTKLSQVVYNLLVNSIRYATADPHEFRILVVADEDSESEFFVIKFKDWGIGVNEGFKDRIFDDYVRSPEAIAEYPNGTGLGLSIARKIMQREIGGDLVLASLSQPTEFHIKIPKRYRKQPIGWRRNI